MKKKSMTIQDKLLIWMENNNGNHNTASKDDVQDLIAEGIVYSKRSFYDAMKNLRKKGYAFYDDGRYWLTANGEDYLIDKNLICSKDDDCIDSKADDSKINQPNVFADAYEKAMDAFKLAMDAFKIAIKAYK